jgi:hypothetical protein
MDAVTLSELRKPRAYPAVSVLMPTHRSVPDNRQDPIRLRNLLSEVRRRLHDDARVAPDAADHVLRGLERAADEVDLRHASDGLVLFAAPDGEHHAFTIGQPVDERVVVDTGFATRDLVAAYTRTPRYWLLSLSDQRARLWDGHGEELTERATAGFPVEPAAAIDSSVPVPTVGTSNRMSCWGLATFTTVKPPCRHRSPARRMQASVPSIASTASTA